MLTIWAAPRWRSPQGLPALFKKSFFLLSPSSLPPLGSTQTPHSSTQASAQYKHCTPCARNNNKKKIVWKQKQTGRKKRHWQTSAAARRGAVFFCRRCFSAARFAFVHGDRSFITSRSKTATPPVIFLSRKQSKYSENKINRRQSPRF